MSLISWSDFQKLGDEWGSLVALEIGMERAVPFDIRRVYYICRTAEGVSRGFHAHRNLRQVAICVAEVLAERGLLNLTFDVFQTQYR